MSINEFDEDREISNIRADEIEIGRYEGLQEGIEEGLKEG